MTSSAPSPRTPSWVLLADQHDDTRTMYAQYLQLEGCQVEQAVDGREALAKALTRRYDVIVTETHLTGIDGYELCRLLRRDPATAATPVIVVTSDAVPAAHDRARAAGASAVLVKPCLPEAIVKELRRIEARAADATVATLAAHASSAAAGLAPAKRQILSRVHKRGDTTAPPLPPPPLLCPACDNALTYTHSHLGGVSARHSEQWDYFDCPGGCGTFEYRQRTRRMVRVDSRLGREVIRPSTMVPRHPSKRW